MGLSQISCNMKHIKNKSLPLSITHPELIKEWDCEANGELNPDLVTLGLATKVWWKCHKGHKWEARINSRANGVGCPYCSNKRVLEGYNDLSTTNPSLAAEWDYDRNYPLKSSDVVAGSNRKVWWKCAKGHNWTATICSRTVGSGCPYCKNNKVLRGYNDLKTTNPELAKEWNYSKNIDISPDMFMSMSNKKVWWKCSEGHEWEAVISSRSLGGGCPYCKNRRVLAGYNDLATVNPRLALEWDYEKNHPLQPSDVTIGNDKKVWWRCSEGHKWEATTSHRSRGEGCPYCSGRYAIEGVNDLNTLYPELTKEWDYSKNTGLTPNNIKSSSHQKIWWKCSDGHEWEESVSSRVSHRVCPICKNIEATVIREQSVSDATINIRGANSENEGLSRPMEIFANDKFVEKISGEKVEKTCKSSINHRVCSVDNSLAKVAPELAKEWNFDKNRGLNPDSIRIRSSKKVWWKCSKGHEWQSTVSHRIDGCGCPYCSGRYAITGINDLATVNPDLAKEWNYEKNVDLAPSSVLPMSSKKVWWKCSKGHEWESKINNRSHGKGCPYCSGQKVLAGFNDLATVYPDLAREWDYKKNGDLRPETVTSMSSHKVWWMCSKGHEWRAAIYSRAQSRGCPYCQGSQTSLPEQGIAFYLESVCNVEQRVKIKGKEIDVFLPEYSVGIEYDGCYYHKGEQSKLKENEKDDKVRKEGVFLIRIKESDVNDNSSEDTIKFISDDMGMNYVWALRQLFNTLHILTDDDSFIGIDIDIKRDRLKIRERMSLYEKDNNISLKYPELLSEWHPTKNGVLTPDLFTPGSKEYVWWMCSKGHEWKAAINSRTKGTGCPYCCGKRLLKGFNDLMTVNPESLSEWDSEKNELSPDQYTAYSNAIVWWKCSKGHEWQATIGSRTQHHGCPYCSGRAAIAGENDLATLFPQIAQEWNYERNQGLINGNRIDISTPDKVTSRSGKKVWWKCAKGHEWEAVIGSRTANNNGCPYCSGKKILIGINDLASQDPLLSSQWNYDKNAGLTNGNGQDISTPDKVSLYSNQNVWWKCSKGHEWKSPVNRRSKGNGCPYCSDQLVLSGYNDLLTTKPQLVEEWNYEKNTTITPKEIVAGSNKKVWWKCSKGHEWETSVANRTRGTGCPFCSNSKVLAGYNDLRTTHPNLISEWDFVKNSTLKPSEVSAGSNKKVWWKCSVGHEWQAQIANRTKGNGCPYCSQQRIGRLHRKRVVNVETNIEYDSIYEASLQTGANRQSISLACNNSNKTAGGYHWRFLEQ